MVGETKAATCSHCKRFIAGPTSDGVLEHSVNLVELFREGIPRIREVRRIPEGIVIEYCLDPVGPNHYG